MALPRLFLLLEVRLFRVLMSVGMALHRVGDPRPISASGTIRIPSRTSQKNGEIELLFYTPKGYPKRLLGSGSSGRQPEASPGTWPVVLNFHGGGFTLGSPSDDARWASSVVQSLGAVVVSVGYRLAPEHPFPTAIEDGVNALKWIHDHARQLQLDRSRVALSGFSAGGNLSFAILLAWQDQADNDRREAQHADSSPPDSRAAPIQQLEGQSLLSGSTSELAAQEGVPDGSPVAAIVSWYPPVDSARPRAVRRASNLGGADKSLPLVLTNMFDASYHGDPSRPGAVDVAHPYLSPALASDETLRQAFPRDILLYTCEWDQLFAEGEGFRTRLSGLGKKVQGRKVPRAKHAWDRSPSGFGRDKNRDEIYDEACTRLRGIFRREESD